MTPAGSGDCALCDGTRGKRLCETNCGHRFHERCFVDYALAIGASVACVACGQGVSHLRCRLGEGEPFVHINYQKIVYTLSAGRSGPFVLCHKLFGIPLDRIKIVARGQAFVPARLAQLEEVVRQYPETVLFVVGLPTGKILAPQECSARLAQAHQASVAARVAATETLGAEAEAARALALAKKEQARAERKAKAQQLEREWAESEARRIGERRQALAARARPSTVETVSAVGAGLMDTIARIPLVSLPLRAVSVVRLFFSTIVYPYENADARSERRERDTRAAMAPRKPIGRVAGAKPMNHDAPMGG